ncbi:MAG: dihydrofolate reductase [Candidatus Paceibacterota bacterium]
MISLIAAIGKNNELGKNNTLLWSLPADMSYFIKTTSGHPVIMGRKTFESIGRPLPKRRNIIITRDNNYKVENAEVVHSLEEALGLSKDKNEEVFIIGGAEIYRQSIDLADRLYITHVDDTRKDADTFFPEIIPIVWNETSHEEHKRDEKNAHAYTFSVYERF